MRKKRKNQELLKPIPVDRFDYINDDNTRTVSIPVGPMFQADVPEWTGSSCKKHESEESSRFLGATILSNKDLTSNEVDFVGKGRPDSCDCYFPGSFNCVKRHVADEKIRLLGDLKHVFLKWKFDEMGEAVSKSWNQEEQENFASLVKKNPKSQGKSFMEPALQCFPSRSRKDIVRYYFNVYVPRQMSLQTRLGIYTDDEGEENFPHSNISKKRCQADKSPLCTSLLAKDLFLTVGR